MLAASSARLRNLSAFGIAVPWLLFLRKDGVAMSIVKRHLAEHEVRMALIEEICIDKGALVLDPDTGDVYFSADNAAEKAAYVAVFQAWAMGTIKGTAEQIFDATKSVLEG
jgi:hypothetical protein